MSPVDSPHLRAVYAERNALAVALVMVLHRLDGLRTTIHVGPDTKPGPGEGMMILTVDSELIGQMSWHIHADDLAVLGPLDGSISDPDDVWDGSTKAEQLARLATFARAEAARWSGVRV